jgi:hypothetical protein
MDERPEMDSRDGREPDPAALFGALHDDLEHGRARDQQQSDGGEAEEPKRSGVRKDHGYHSGPCGGTTSPRSAAR